MKLSTRVASLWVMLLLNSKLFTSSLNLSYSLVFGVLPVIREY
jgi:hypothetical protein